MPLFYTKKGDKGLSHVGKKKVDKTCIEVEALGELDELNSMIGLVKSTAPKDFKKILQDVQESLFIVQASVAAGIFGAEPYKIPKLDASKTSGVEDIIDKFEKILKPTRGFIIAGSDPLSAWLDLLRARSRATERSVLKINKKLKLDPNILAYLNRLSSLFFAMARMASKMAGKKESHPSYR